MQIVLLAALGVGGATIFGAAVGFVFKDVSHKYTDIVLGFACGIMLCASFFGLIIPAMEFAETNMPQWVAILVVVTGIFFGAAILCLLDKILPCNIGSDKESKSITAGVALNETAKKSNGIARQRVILFVLAIAIHNLPEGIASGVGFGTDNIGVAFSVTLGIALQNIPEGMIVISPMLAAGFSKKKTMLIAVFTGVIEIIGTFIGYFAVAISQKILPIALATAAGTMIYVICEEMIPETHEYGRGIRGTLSLLVGFCLMLALNYFIA